MINKEVRLPITRQCKVLELSRSGVYYTPVAVSTKDRELMRQIDGFIFTIPFMGAGRFAMNYGRGDMISGVTRYVV